MTPLDMILIELERCDRRAARLSEVQARNEDLRSALRLTYGHLLRRLPQVEPTAGPDVEPIQESDGSAEKAGTTITPRLAINLAPADLLGPLLEVLWAAEEPMTTVAAREQVRKALGIAVADPSISTYNGRSDHARYKLSQMGALETVAAGEVGADDRYRISPAYRAWLESLGAPRVVPPVRDQKTAFVRFRKSWEVAGRQG